MKHLLLSAILLFSLGCRSLNDRDTRAMAHDLRVEIEQQFRDVAEQTGDAELEAKIDKVAGLADIAATAWDAYLDGDASQSDLARSVRAAIDGAYLLVPYVVDDTDRSLLIKAALGSLKVLVLQLAREAEDEAAIEKATALP